MPQDRGKAEYGAGRANLTGGNNKKAAAKPLPFLLYSENTLRATSTLSFASLA